MLSKQKNVAKAFGDKLLYDNLNFTYLRLELLGLWA
jgi:hypothetical protein